MRTAALLLAIAGETLHFTNNLITGSEAVALPAKVKKIQMDIEVR